MARVPAGMATWPPTSDVARHARLDPIFHPGRLARHAGFRLQADHRVGGDNQLRERHAGADRSGEAVRAPPLIRFGRLGRVSSMGGAGSGDCAVMPCRSPSMPGRFRCAPANVAGRPFPARRSFGPGSRLAFGRAGPGRGHRLARSFRRPVPSPAPFSPMRSVLPTPWPRFLWKRSPRQPPVEPEPMPEWEPCFAAWLSNLLPPLPRCRRRQERRKQVGSKPSVNSLTRPMVRQALYLGACCRVPR